MSRKCLAPGCRVRIADDRLYCSSCRKNRCSDDGFYDTDEEKLMGDGDLKVYEGTEIRKLAGFEIDRIIEDLGGIPNDDRWIKDSIKNVVGTLSKEEMKKAVKDIKLHIQNQQKLNKEMGD